jgi:acyl-CoA dehydrogenase
MRRDLFTEDHEAFRELARDFVEKEVVPAYPEWEKGGRMPRDVFKKMGALGMLGMAIPEQYGGAGMPDYRYNVVLQEEAARALVTLLGRRDPAHRRRDDRTGNRIRPRGYAHDRCPRR